MLKHILLPLFALSVLSADTLTSSGEKHHGRLSTFEKGQFTFMEYDKSAPSVFPIGMVSRIDFDKPTQADLYLDAHARKAQKGLIRAFRKGKFQIILKGKKQKLSPRYLPRIAINYSIMEFQEAKERWEAHQDSAEEGSAQKAQTYAQTGKVTIVHFDDGSPASRRQGNLCARLQREYPDKLVYVVLKAPLGSPMAKLNRLKSTPQFWFYAHNRELKRKLANRFTEADVSNAVQAVRRLR